MVVRPFTTQYEAKYFGLPQILLSLFAMLFTLTVSAETKLNASVDRNKIYEHDTLNLTISGEVKMDFSFGGLMNFGRSQLEAPNMEELLNDFEILDQNQNYSMRSINGDTKAQVTWTYSIAPKRTGSLTIPAISYQGGSSQALAIEVLPGKAPRNADTPPLVFIEAEVDKQSAYVQEQVRYVLRLYSADHLATGDLSEPAPSDAIVEGIGDTKKYYRMAYNKRYEVREREYLLFPQKSGQLTIEPQTFDGMLIDTRTRRRLRVREASEAITLDIKPPPAEFSGDIWLPATSFELTEKWDKEPYDLKVGDSVTRTLEISSLGLLGSALPPLKMKDIPGLKIYPDQPSVESFEHEGGAQSVRQETSALVAISANQITLPEIRIPWWDTVNDVERVAVIPSRPFEIMPNPEQLQASPAITSSPAIQQTVAGESNAAIPEEAIAQALPTEQTVVQEANNQPWYLIITLLLVGWMSTTWLLISRQQRLLKSTNSIEQVANTNHFDALTKAVKTSSPELPKLLVSWANERFGKVNSIDDLKSIDELLYESARALEAQLYSASNSGSISIDNTALLKRVKELNQSKSKPSKAVPLQPMYP